MAKLREELAAKFGGVMQHSLGVGQDDRTTPSPRPPPFPRETPGTNSMAPVRPAMCDSSPSSRSCPTRTSPGRSLMRRR
jgi:hypothetical protein